jgi:hypothetical protein
VPFTIFQLAKSWNTYLKARMETRVRFEAMVYVGLLKMLLAKAVLCRMKQSKGVALKVFQVRLTLVF